nr:hypothetical protein [Faecalicatena contorta]
MTEDTGLQEHIALQLPLQKPMKAVAITEKKPNSVSERLIADFISFDSK